MQFKLFSTVIKKYGAFLSDLIEISHVCHQKLNFSVIMSQYDKPVTHIIDFFFLLSCKVCYQSHQNLCTLPIVIYLNPTECKKEKNSISILKGVITNSYVSNSVHKCSRCLWYAIIYIKNRYYHCNYG